VPAPEAPHEDITAIIEVTPNADGAELAQYRSLKEWRSAEKGTRMTGNVEA
jgi:hypothetical protein